jgi:hypothetical protein
MQFAQLKDGPLVPIPALTLICDLDLSGCMLTVEGDRLRVARKDGKPVDLTDEQRADIKRFKAHLMLLVEYAKRTDIPPPEGGNDAA